MLVVLLNRRRDLLGTWVRAARFLPRSLDSIPRRRALLVWLSLENLGTRSGWSILVERACLTQCLLRCLGN